MPIIPLPSGDTGLAGGDLPVEDASDVLQEFPVPIKKVAVAPVRDAFVEGYASGFLKYQTVAERAAAQSDPMRATGEYLLDYAEEHSVIPRTAESNQSIRDRLFLAPDIVTPDAIIAGVKAILAAYTSTDPDVFLSELELDGWFVHDHTTSVWDSFVGAEPNYPDRYYAEVPSSLPGGAVPSQGLPRNFVLRVPALGPLDSSISYVGPSYVGVDFYVYDNPGLSDEVYLQIIHYVESVKGQGFSWSLVTY